MGEETVTVKLNGGEIAAVPGETVLHVARRAGVYIPTLCHVDALKPLGTCRMCLV
ncbi:2Fe-2S iron-sulfur cluster binding domain-containing protein, partial [bacterium]|nr:2Fe-2S iron-sulfur cluster binding domain-containing protein [bacterium]